MPAVSGREMIAAAEEFAILLSQYQQGRLEYIAWIDQKIQLLQTLKQGMELLLLVSSYLIFYLMDCIAEVMAMPIPFVG